MQNDALLAEIYERIDAAEEYAKVEVECKLGMLWGLVFLILAPISLVNVFIAFFILYVLRVQYCQTTLQVDLASLKAMLKRAVSEEKLPEEQTQYGHQYTTTTATGLATTMTATTWSSSSSAAGANTASTSPLGLGTGPEARYESHESSGPPGPAGIGASHTPVLPTAEKVGFGGGELAGRGAGAAGQSDIMVEAGASSHSHLGVTRLPWHTCWRDAGKKSSGPNLTLAHFPPSYQNAHNGFFGNANSGDPYFSHNDCNCQPNTKNAATYNYYEKLGLVAVQEHNCYGLKFIFYIFFL